MNMKSPLSSLHAPSKEDHFIRQSIFSHVFPESFFPSLRTKCCDFQDQNLYEHCYTFPLSLWFLWMVTVPPSQDCKNSFMVYLQKPGLETGTFLLYSWYFKTFLFSISKVLKMFDVSSFVSSVFLFLFLEYNGSALLVVTIPTYCTSYLQQMPSSQKSVKRKQKISPYEGLLDYLASEILLNPISVPFEINL